MSYVRIIAIAAIVLAIMAGLWKLRHGGVVQGRAETQAEWDADKAKTAVETALKLAAANKQTATLQAQADKERGTLNARIHSIDLELDESLRRLRARPTRPAESDSGVPPDTGSGLDAKGCTGSGLFAQDGEFLAREASRADALRSRLTYCEDRYRDAQGMINATQ